MKQIFIFLLACIYSLCIKAENTNWETSTMNNISYQVYEFDVFGKDIETRGFIYITDSYIKICLMRDASFKEKNYEQCVLTLYDSKNVAKKIFGTIKNNKIWIDKYFFNGLINPNYEYLISLKNAYQIKCFLYNAQNDVDSCTFNINFALRH